MTITLDLTSDEEARLRQKAAKKGLPPEDLVAQAVKTIIPAADDDIEARLARLDSILLDPADDQERKETWEFLKKALDEDRLSYRKFFP